MLRAILSAIKSALKDLFGGPLALLWELLMMPVRAVDGLLSGGVPPAPSGPGPNRRALEKALAADESMEKNHEKVARAVLRWGADSIIGDAPATVPSWLPRAVKEWLPGLSRDECEMLISMDNALISTHVRGIYQIKGVRKVQPLRPEPWPPIPSYVEPGPGFAYHLTASPTLR